MIDQFLHLTPTHKEFLNWVADRFVYLYQESEQVDFVQRLREIPDKEVNLSQLQQESHRIAVEHGWWDNRNPDSVLELLMLIVTEVAEGAEAYRDKLPIQGGAVYGKPVGLASELADILIRVGDMAEGLGIDLTRAVITKMEYNKTRSYRHGGKLA